MDKSYKHNVKQKKTEIKALVDRGITDYWLNFFKIVIYLGLLFFNVNFDNLYVFKIFSTLLP